MQIDAEKLRLYAEAYGVAVRAGAITPNRVDEEFFRKLFGLPKQSDEVQRAWDESDGVKAPITLANKVQTTEPVPDVTPEEQQALNMVKAKLDEENPRLSQSDFARFDFAWAKSLKEDYQKIWNAGGNIRGEEAFEYWTKYNSGDRGEGVLAWVKEREAWAARHYNDGAQFKGSDLEPNLSNIAGIIAQIKWGVVGTLGESRMKSIVNQVKDKQD